MRSIKRCKRSVAIAATTMVLASCSIGEALPVPATYYAKELCSCLFVVGQSEAYCRSYAQEDIADLGDLPFVDLDDRAKIDFDSRRVTVSLLFERVTASYVDTRRGCALSPNQSIARAASPALQ
jgi:hypothetical protein